MKLRIFVIDDEECITETFKWHLTDLGHEVICMSEPMACHVYEGGQCNHEHPCADILFVDKNMPNMTGLEFVEHMENKGCKGFINNKVLMSGAFDKSDIEKAKELGCRIVDKPLTLAQIDAWIDEIKSTIPPDRKLADLPETL